MRKPEIKQRIKAEGNTIVFERKKWWITKNRKIKERVREERTEWCLKERKNSWNTKTREVRRRKSDPRIKQEKHEEQKDKNQAKNKRISRFNKRKNDHMAKN